MERSPAAFLHVFDEARQRELAALARPRRFAPGEVIFREGDAGREIYWVESGRVRLEICAPGIGCRAVMTVRPGELLGWSPLLAPEQPMTATARAVTEVSAMGVDAASLREQCERDPVFGFQLMREVSRALARRLTAARLQLLDIHQSPAS